MTGPPSCQKLTTGLGIHCTESIWEHLKQKAIQGHSKSFQLHANILRFTWLRNHIKYVYGLPRIHKTKYDAAL